MGDFVDGLFHYLVGDAAKELTRDEDRRDAAEKDAFFQGWGQRMVAANKTYSAPQLIPEDPPLSATIPPPPGLDLGGSAPGAVPADDGMSFTAPTPTPATEVPADVAFSPPPGTSEVSLTVSDGGGATGTPLTEDPPVTTTFTPPAPAAAPSQPGTTEAELGMSTFELGMPAAESVALAATPPHLTVELSAPMVETTAAAPEQAQAASESVTFAYGRTEQEYQPAAEPGPPQSGESPGAYALKRWALAFGIVAVLLGLVIVLVAHSRGSSPAPTGPSSLTGGSTSPPPVSSFSNVELPNNTLSFVPGVCPAATLHLSWTLTGIAPDTAVVIHLSGRGVPSSLTFRASPGVPFGQDFPISGAGTWSTTIVSIGGQPPPPAVAPDAVRSGPYAC